ncbi:hypothetical protein [Actinomadura sp. CNU-125]|uniref:hypothetical protein n=1 Tax=Actinomadura sp. CNU-125 TaxID=1904961 RepID=UPI000AAD4151|nr:hypothetical protein [Actinomadura sp. CNU-125]
MRVTWATDEGDPRRGNEDFVAAAPGAAVVLDGCGLPLGTDLGCVHGTAWYSRALGTRLLARMLDGLGPQAGPPVGPPEGAHVRADRPLVGRLAGAVADVAAAHRATCDLSAPTTPAATVLAVRVRGDLLDYLVLADSTLLLDCATPARDHRRALLGRVRSGRGGGRDHRDGPAPRRAARDPADRRRHPPRRRVRRHRLGGRRPVGRRGWSGRARRAHAGGRAHRPAGRPLAPRQAARRRHRRRLRLLTAAAPVRNRRMIVWLGWAGPTRGEPGCGWVSRCSPPT